MSALLGSSPAFDHTPLRRSIPLVAVRDMLVVVRLADCRAVESPLLFVSKSCTELTRDGRTPDNSC